MYKEPAMTPATTVIIGGGHAGGEAALALRQGGYSGRILLISDELSLPYQRPPLSKAFLTTEIEPEKLLIRAPANFTKAEVELVLGHPVSRIDRSARTVHLDDGTEIHWSHLILATGSRARRLALPDPLAAEPANLFYLRSLADAQRLKASLEPGGRLLIIGGGFIGLEVASAAISLGLSVSVVEAQDRLLARVTAPEVSAFYATLHRSRGVRILTGAHIERFELSDDGARLSGATLTDGQHLEADLVLAGIGAVAQTELAEQAGLELDNGILVNEFCQSSDPAIYAIGDCSRHYSRVYDRRLRLESVPNAVDQARTAAHSINGVAKPYEPVPWFWSDQYEIKLQMVGLSEGYDEIVMRGDPQQNSFVAFYFAAGRLIAADCVNRSSEFALVKRLVQARPSDEVASALADPASNLKDLL
jgi:3-phenylpropionate/trans-cinnamate dioxygenase ferredoxin reductase component